ncbi:carboxypeptidase-like regulatory domain-containing protein [Gelidibacter salicanalis]|uniref:Carboxypeptidase-like regulatory domain-containing protein n=1 Tax=Gelidibacter salicanalis TaxID=291193 RepID=A0A5C7AKT8_9FLAO|nr:carboxypeptidase-like regulatory domain-containing protein [Gelidibacter salicanalis]TXE09346.1 carboxypeptidase-like regulatory domain-containing protein [Gelidibacter salicanalis]
MKTALLYLLLIMPLFMVTAQTIKRVEISGKIVVENSDLENITIYNSSSKKGTLTDESGMFTINVALNDIIEVRALLFQDFTVTIDDNIIKTRSMTVFLVEKVNKLDEIIILPYDLTGNLLVDIESVKTFNPDLDAIYFGLANMNDYEFPDDYKSKVVNIAMPGTGNNIQYGFDVIGIVELFLRPIFKTKKKDTREEALNEMSYDDFTELYSTKFLVENFNIPEPKVEEFIKYVEEEGLDYSLLNSGKEFQFLEFISQKSKEFLAKNDTEE